MAAYQRITSKDIRATLPTRHLRFVFDIESFFALGELKASLLETFFESVKSSWYNLDIEILAPSYPPGYVGASIDIPAYKWLNIVPEDWKPKPNESHEKLFQKNHTENNSETAYSLYLMAMADYCQADGVITDKKILVKHRYSVTLP
ncbi:hypothetical protein [Desulfoferula mesophila]|uniref:Uncharacterized protein n=1 Tax=Desulfoferula mesophila TaxID=3058419 RepID=A0AAU9EM99_9BACT|nr:hypothetical protein FAK_27450 [Desulfoferula mesophilus]